VRKEKSRGVSVKLNRERGGYGKSALLPLDTDRTEEGAVRGGLAMVAGGLPGHGGGREVGEQREEVEGKLFRPSPWLGTTRGGGSTAAGRLQGDAALLAVVGAQGRERERGDRKVRGEEESGAGYL
jgi:hypothetical protein